MSWQLGPRAAFDLETTGVDVEQDRIVTAAVIYIDGTTVKPRTWLLNPGIEIPIDATKIHGISTAQAEAEGMDAAKGVEEIATAVAELVTAGVPLVGHNVSYDLTLLDRECRRHGLGGLEDICGQPIRPVIDTRVLDQQVLTRRKRVSAEQGARVLKTVAQVFGLSWDDEAAHGCEFDAMVSARVAWWIGEIAHRGPSGYPAWVLSNRYARFGTVAGLSLDELHDRQVVWAREQAASLQEWFRTAPAERGGDPNAVVDGSWPLRPFRQAVAASGAALPPP
ncbi:exonuclease domain-containing protein [Kitasatospora sp. NBC_01287]|uniref:exonuclease domain-containing protein n=1 Tax=Kitasatospora sp. NBC_01287 TaxID=2903573 RepID=UPI0022592708|nr:exonuclease domain-containing protein [Kitasatospora sp. NBC_01287]MCX4751716.1 exonuclease domain-containing protein [Kitasatospora sp. NBC_01287]MCX4751992.1 exonuclease domain-containing protein [Kitasatospora sp. NBC_01287]